MVGSSSLLPIQISHSTFISLSNPSLTLVCPFSNTPWGNSLIVTCVFPKFSWRLEPLSDLQPLSFLRSIPREVPRTEYFSPVFFYPPCCLYFLPFNKNLVQSNLYPTEGPIFQDMNRYTSEMNDSSNFERSQSPSTPTLLLYRPFLFRFLVAFPTRVLELPS